jgi:tetratricopeptide (TPR) repeat protein
MADIGFNDNLTVTGRKFHFQTASNTNSGEVQCEIFEEGRLLSKEVIEFERRKFDKVHSIENRLKEMVEELHQDMMSEIEIMFLIGEKIKKLKHSPSNTKMGILFQQHNLVDDAVEHFELAIQNDPDYIDGYINLGRTYSLARDFEKANAIFKQAMEKGKRYADLHNHFGYSLLSENQFPKALHQLQESLKINNDYAEAHYNLAILYFKSTLFDQSDEKLPPASIRLQRGVEQLNKLKKLKIKSFDQVEEKIQKVLDKQDYENVVKILEENKNKLFYRDSMSLIGTSFYLKFMYGGKGLDNEIIKKYEQKLTSALGHYPNYADIWNNLGIIHLIQCRNLFLKALEEFKKALEINPGFEKARKNKKLVENDGKEFLILLRAILK